MYVFSPPSGTSQNDFMRDWLNVKMDFLQEIVEREYPVGGIRCERCGSTEAIWRCLDCFACPTMCRECLRSVHQSSPFHRVEIWSTTHFEPSWLWRTDVASSSTDDVLVQDDNYDTFTSTFDHGARPPHRTVEGAKVVVVLHSNGVHHCLFHTCQCPNSKPERQQFLAYGLYPASLKDVRTVATFSLLDDHHMSTVECHTSTYAFYNRLCRVTNKAFPQTVPDQYRELGRMSRQWLHLKELKWFGFSHDPTEPGPGSLAIFCPGCPQPGVNITEQEWKDLSDVPKVRSFVADGNFSAVHQRQRLDVEDVWLKNGESYMTEKRSYKAHLAVAHESKQKPNCHDHRAIADRWKGMKGCDATGIGAIACMRHRCFAPCSVVDFQKGEQQKNIDYGFVKAIDHTHVPRGTRIIFCYDVNCQYCVNFRKRAQASPALASAQHYPITFAIGLWHVHGHRPECYPRHAPSLVPGAARKSGEILESLWDSINGIFGATRTMTNAHRVEILDAIMADSNWKKLTSMVVTIAHEVVRAKNEAAESEIAFAAIDQAITKKQRADWESQVNKAQKLRHRNPNAMDIYNSKSHPPISRVHVELDLMGTERATGKGKGITRWISLGIKIQEQQCHLLTYIKQHSRFPTDIQRLTLARRREQLLDSITEFHRLGESLFPSIDFSTLSMSFFPLLEELDQVEEWVDESEDEVLNTHSTPALSWREPEYLDLPLPSSIDHQPAPLEAAAAIEVKLRVAQANNELENLKDQIGRLSFMYRGVLRPAKTKVAKTQANHLLASANHKKRLHARLYNQAHWALLRLHASNDVMRHLRPIISKDLGVSTAIAEPNAQGQSSVSLSWIWTSPQSADANCDDQDSGSGGESLPAHTPGDAQHLEEACRCSPCLNWMRAWEKAARWDEEYAYLWHEMSWVTNFFHHKAAKWEEVCRTEGSPPTRPGHEAYAQRQAAVWTTLAEYAKVTFSEVEGTLDSLLSDDQSSSGSDIASESRESPKLDEES
ncbi:hypothetical protein BKA70DRAFT_1380025 [Coprinopsis sp. MPI-PUGE-AT-0042]|nr:hypothetical protein BKA70DRAFT_1380025 [Coprinopsis sp. MPI-PUGE-AT-0042]